MGRRATGERKEGRHGTKEELLRLVDAAPARKVRYCNGYLQGRSPAAAEKASMRLHLHLGLNGGDNQGVVCRPVARAKLAFCPYIKSARRSLACFSFYA